MSLKATWAGNNAISKVLIVFGSFLFCYIFFPLMSVLIASRAYGFSISSLLESNSEYLTNERFLSALRFMQIVSAIGVFIFLAFILAYLFDFYPLSYLRLNKKISFLSGVMVIMAMIASVPLINYLGELNSHAPLPSIFKVLEDKAADVMKSLLVMHSTSDVLFNLFMFGLLPALGEELLFRGIIQKIFSEWSKNMHIGVWITAILFSAMHLQFYGFIPRMLLGALLGYLLVWSGSLWLPIIAHFVNNASAVVFTYLFNEQMMAVDPDKLGTENDYVSVLISALLTGILLWLIYKKERKKIYAESYG